MVAVTMLADLEKRFNRVTDATLKENADVFPDGILILALSMYIAPRKISCGKACSRAVFSKTGVLAGCPIAIGLLLLSLLRPVDRFYTSIPRRGQ